jgi:hypothetical protein
MRQILWREFRTRGASALPSVPAGDLSGQDDPTFFLVPALGDVATEDRALRRTTAKASLCNNWNLAQTSPGEIPDAAINKEIQRVRSCKRRKKL